MQTSELELRVATTEFLVRCGGPYPADAALSPVESSSTALDMIADALLDAVPHSAWDRTMVNAFRKARRVVAKKRGLLAGFRVGTELERRERRLERLIDQNAGRSKWAQSLTATERIIVVIHLVELFSTAVLLQEAELDREWPVVMKAVDAALLGLLPVGISETATPFAVLVY